jgi:DnaD/phage-associated family protein
MAGFKDFKLLLGDTLVPDLFISDHVASLDEVSLKTYLVLLHTAQRGFRPADVDELAGRLGITPLCVEQALLTLIARELVEQIDGRYVPVDLKEKEVERHIEAVLGRRYEIRSLSREEVTERERIVTEVNDAFFQGVMSGTWYREIDRWFSEFNFEPKVVYALFVELGSRQKLDHIGYARQMALNWHKNGVSTYEQLVNYQEAYSVTKDFVQKVAKKLRIKLSEFDIDAVSAWREELGFSYDIVELALKKSTRARGGGSIAFFDAILREWYDHNLKTKEAVEAYERDRKTASAVPARRASAKGNFSDQGKDDPYTGTFHAGVRLPRLLSDETGEQK